MAKKLLRDRLPILGTLRSVTLFAVIFLAAAAWAEALLRVSEATADFVLSEEELAEFAESADNESSGDDDEDISTEQAREEDTSDYPDDGANETPPADPRPSDSRETEELHVESNEDGVAIAGEDLPIATTSDSSSNGIQDELPSENSDIAVDSDSSSEPPNEPAQELLLTTGESGSLASFDGISPVGGSNPINEATGANAGLQWNIEFVQRPQLARLQSLVGTQLAAIRQRHGGVVEIALINDRHVLRPILVDEFISRHVNFRGRRGILLDHEWLSSFQDRLLTYGGGWQMWLLIENELFAEWLEVSDSELVSRGIKQKNVQRIDAQLVIQHRTGQPYPVIRILDVQVRKLFNEAAADNTAVPDNSVQE